MHLELAKEEDLPVIVEMTNNFIWESGYFNYFKSDPDRIKEIALQLIQRTPKDACILLLKDEKYTVGFLAAMAVEQIFSKDRMATEFAWWVDPTYRGTKWSIELLNAYEFWAKGVANCAACQMVCLEALSPEKVSKLYEKRGYKKVEQAFIKGLR